MTILGSRVGKFLVCLLLISSVGMAGLLTVSADSDLNLTISETTDVPSEKTELDGDQYEIDAFAVRDQGDSLSAMTFPDEGVSDMRHSIYNSDQQIEDSHSENQPDQIENVTFETDEYPPGTYLLSIELEGATEEIHPVVISGYDITVEHPSEATQDDEINITATVTPTAASESPEDVEVVLWNESDEETFEMTTEDDNEYTASIELDQFDTDEYTVNVVARGEDTIQIEPFQGEQEILALESESSLTVIEGENITYIPNTPWQGKEVVAHGNDIDGDEEYGLRKISSFDEDEVEDSTFVMDLASTEATETQAQRANSRSANDPISEGDPIVVIDTENLDIEDGTEDYYLRGGTLPLNPKQDDTFEVRVQSLNTEFADEAVSNNGGNSETQIDFDSNRARYTLNASADGDLDEEELFEILTGLDFDNDFDEADRVSYSDVANQNDTAIETYGEFNVFLYEDGEDGEKLDHDEKVGMYQISDREDEVDFADINPGQYDFKFEATDSSAVGTASISVFGDIVEPDGPPMYNLTLENDGSVYSVGFPSSTNGTLEDIFVNGFDGVSAVYEYDSGNNQWQLLSGDDFSRDIEELEAIVVITDGQSEPNNVDLSIKFGEQTVTQPSQRTLEEGWEFTSASTFDDADTVFERGTADVTIVLDSFETPRIDQLGTDGHFLNQQATPYYDLGGNQPPQMNPFKGYFVFVTEEGTHPSIVSGVESRQQADQALNATDVG